ncbi:MAG: hypothetical protein ACFCUT_13095 [Kiloniellaceae bacterium]
MPRAFENAPRKLCIAATVVCLCGSWGAALAADDVVQEPAQVCASQDLAAGTPLQRPQLSPACLGAIDAIAGHRKPQFHFVASATTTPLDGPEVWSNDLVGPRLAGIADSRPPALETLPVRTEEELRAAVRNARPGTVIEVQPGTYDFSGASIGIDSPGQPDLPIVVRAPALGSVHLKFSLLEGFRILAPFWTFENLVIEGICQDDNRCEHAFHVVGDAVGVVIQNNWVTNFNAAVKVNGKDGRFPDEGIIRYNTFLNDRPRNTDRTVAVLDLVSVSRWRVQKNLIADFGKASEDLTSYGAFFKGAGEDNVFEQNLVRCEWRHSGHLRIGFSFGDGGTGRRFCRDGGCRVEHRRGIARNNIIMNCPNDAGIYLSKSAETLVHNNALIATRGIDVRYPESDATILNNIVDGSIRARDGGSFVAQSNIVAPPLADPSGTVSSDVYVDGLGGDFRLKDSQAVIGRGVAIEGNGLDLCNQLYGPGSPDIGPIQYGQDIGCLPRVP